MPEIDWVSWIWCVFQTTLTTWGIHKVTYSNYYDKTGQSLPSIVVPGAINAIGGILAIIMLRSVLISVQSKRRFSASKFAETLTALYFFLAAFSSVNTIIGIRDSLGHVTHDFWTSVYFTTMTVTTVGYGDFTPNGPAGRAVACVAALSGYLILAFLVAIMCHPRDRTSG